MESITSSLNKKDNPTNKSSNIEYVSFPVELLIITKLIPHSIFSEECICSNKILNNSRNKINILEEKELISSLKIPIINKNEENLNISLKKNNSFQFRIFDLCNSLEILGFPINGSMINIYLKDCSNYVFYGQAPIDKNILLDSSLINLSCLKIKIINFLDDKIFRNNKSISCNNQSNDIQNESTNLTDNIKKNSKKKNFNFYYSNEDNISENSIKLGSKKTRERRINYVIEKVNAWRKLYNGFINEDNTFIKYDSKEAAKKLNISKKSLDVYLVQLKLGRKYGFDFNEYRNCKIGVLRQFIQLKKVEEQRKKLNVRDFIDNKFFKQFDKEY